MPIAFHTKILSEQDMLILGGASRRPAIKH